MIVSSQLTIVDDAIGLKSEIPWYIFIFDEISANHNNVIN